MIITVIILPTPIIAGSRPISNNSFFNDQFSSGVHHDGRGLTQTDFEKMTRSSGGLGLKNIQSRLKVLEGLIFFEKDISQTYYKITIELPKEEEIIQQQKVKF